MTPTTISYERMYSDGSGTEYAVRITNHREYGQRVEIEHVNSVEFEVSELEWLIEALVSLRAAVKGG